MDIGHIYIYGEIANCQDESANDWGVVSLKSVVKSINSQKQAKEFIVHIHSIGGDVSEGFAIYDALRATGKKITTINEGVCYSIATVIYMAGSTRIANENSSFVIHNEFGSIDGNAEQIAQFATELKHYREKIVQIYIDNGVNKTNDELKAIMLEDRVMTVEEAIELNFATEIKSTIKAVAKFNNSLINKKGMSKKTEKNILNEIASLLGMAKGVKNLKVTDANQVEIDFYDLKDGDVIAIGAKANVDSTPADGEYLMQTGETYVFVSGELTEIKEVQADEVVALQNKVKELEATIAEQQTTVENKKVKAKQLKKELKETNEVLTNLKNIVSKNSLSTKNKKNKKEPKKKESSFMESLNEIKNLKK